MPKPSSEAGPCNNEGPQALLGHRPHVAGGRKGNNLPQPHLLAPPLCPLQLPDTLPHSFQHLQGVGGSAYGFKEQDAASPSPGPFVSGLSTPKGKGKGSCLVLKLPIQGRPQAWGGGGKYGPTLKRKLALFKKEQRRSFLPTPKLRTMIWESFHSCERNST